MFVSTKAVTETSHARCDAVLGCIHLFIQYQLLEGGLPASRRRRLTSPEISAGGATRRRRRDAVSVGRLLGIVTDDLYSSIVHKSLVTTPQIDAIFSTYHACCVAHGIINWYVTFSGNKVVVNYELGYTKNMSIVNTA